MDITLLVRKVLPRIWQKRFAGLWFQCLGLLAVVLNFLAGVAVIGMIVLDLVLLFG